MLVRRAANGGLPVARNTGFDRRAAPYVLPLDADNALYPSGCAACSTPRRRPGRRGRRVRHPRTVRRRPARRRHQPPAVGSSTCSSWRVHRRDGAVASRRRSVAARRLRGPPTGCTAGRTTTCGCRSPSTAPRADLVRSIVGRYREQPARCAGSAISTWLEASSSSANDIRGCHGRARPIRSPPAARRASSSWRRWSRHAPRPSSASAAELAEHQGTTTTFAAARLADAERRLAELESTKLFRYSAAPRRAYGRLRRG